MSFVRMQEFYESPKFKGKYFTLEQYMDYWSKEFGKGSFTYPSVWDGFNIPGKVLSDWWDRFDNDRRYKEKVEFDDIEFNDFEFGHHYDNKWFQSVGPDTSRLIIQKIKENL